MATKTKTTKRSTGKKTAMQRTKTRVAAHTSASIEKRVLTAIKRAGRAYIASMDLAHLTARSTSWVAVTIRRLRDAGHSIESKRGIAGGYRLARA